MNNSTLMVRLAFQTQADLPFSLCVSYIQISSTFTWCPAHTRKTFSCALRGSREVAPKTIMNCPMLYQDAMRPLSPADSMGEALLGASKDLQECEDGVSASCKMDQQCCHWIQLNTEAKAPKVPRAAQPSCPILLALGTFQNSQPTSFTAVL